MGEITPDLVEWIVSDDKVAVEWRSLARRLGFASNIPELEVGRYKGSRAAIKQRGDRHRLQTLFWLWEANNPETYTVRELKNVLAAEGFHDMLIWINMMTQSSPLVAQVSELIYRNITPSPSPRRNTTSPTSGFCYSPRSYLTPTPSTRLSQGVYSPQTTTVRNQANSSYSPYSTPGLVPNSPYSAYFQRSVSPDPSNSSVYISSRDSSRPNSQMSDYYYGESVPSPTGVSRRGTSCPNTPLSSRRSYSPCSTSPGWIRPHPSAGWIRTSTPSHQSRVKSAADKKNVYNLLYRPDLIKLSSPVHKPTREESSRSDRAEISEISDVEEHTNKGDNTTIVKKDLEVKGRNIFNADTPEEKVIPNGRLEKKLNGDVFAKGNNTYHIRASSKTLEIKNVAAKFENPPERKSAPAAVRKTSRDHGGINYTETRRGVNSNLQIRIDSRKKKIGDCADDHARSDADSTYADYFDHLIDLIDKAAKELSV